MGPWSGWQKRSEEFSGLEPLRSGWLIHMNAGIVPDDVKSQGRGLLRGVGVARAQTEGKRVTSVEGGDLRRGAGFGWGVQEKEQPWAEGCRAKGVAPSKHMWVD